MEEYASKVRRELCEKTGTRRDENEKEIKFRHRLLHEIAALSDDDWDTLTTEAQDWTNAAVVAHNQEQQLPPFPDEDKPPVVETPEPQEKPKINRFHKGPKRKISRIDDDMIIRLNVDENPKKPGSLSYNVFNLYRDGMTVREYIEAGGTRAGVRWDYERKYCDLEDKAGNKF